MMILESLKEIEWFSGVAIISSPSIGSTDFGTARFRLKISVCVANKSAFDHNLVWVTCGNFDLIRHQNGN